MSKNVGFTAAKFIGAIGALFILIPIIGILLAILYAMATSDTSAIEAAKPAF